MTRLRTLHLAAMDRNPRALYLDCIAHERIDGENACRSLAEQSNEDSEARFDVEGALCWRDHHAPRRGDAA